MLQKNAKKRYYGKIMTNNFQNIFMLPKQNINKLLKLITGSITIFKMFVWRKNNKNFYTAEKIVYSIGTVLFAFFTKIFSSKKNNVKITKIDRVVTNNLI